MKILAVILIILSWTFPLIIFCEKRFKLSHIELIYLGISIISFGCLITLTLLKIIGGTF